MAISLMQFLALDRAEVLRTTLPASDAACPLDLSDLANGPALAAAVAQMRVWHAEVLLGTVLALKRPVPQAFLIALLESADPEIAGVAIRVVPYADCVSRTLFQAALLADMRMREQRHWTAGMGYQSVLGAWACARMNRPFPSALEYLHAKPEDGERERALGA